MINKIDIMQLKLIDSIYYKNFKENSSDCLEK